MLSFRSAYLGNSNMPNGESFTGATNERIQELLEPHFWIRSVSKERSKQVSN